VNGVYPQTNGGWYYIDKGYFPSNSNEYFFQYGALSTSYNMVVSVTLTSFNIAMVST
jgi:hypothetical protein